MTKLDKDQVLEAFSQAYESANGTKPDIQAKGGWYSIDGGKNVRLAYLVEETQTLLGASTHSKTVANVPAKQAKAISKPKKNKTVGFSVKQFWNEQLTARNRSAALPR